jgi:hypothetical protein
MHLRRSELLDRAAVDLSHGMRARVQAGVYEGGLALRMRSQGLRPPTSAALVRGTRSFTTMCPVSGQRRMRIPTPNPGSRPRE